MTYGEGPGTTKCPCPSGVARAVRQVRQVRLEVTSRRAARAPRRELTQRPSSSAQERVAQPGASPSAAFGAGSGAPGGPGNQGAGSSPTLRRGGNVPLSFRWQPSPCQEPLLRAENSPSSSEGGKGPSSGPSHQRMLFQEELLGSGTQSHPCRAGEAGPKTGLDGAPLTVA